MPYFTTVQCTLLRIRGLFGFFLLGLLAPFLRFVPRIPLPRRVALRRGNASYPLGVLLLRRPQAHVCACKMGP